MDNVNWLSDGKLRLGYGTAGNNRLQAYGYTTGYAPPSNAGYGLNDVLNYTFNITQVWVIQSITWEKLTSKHLVSTWQPV